MQLRTKWVVAVLGAGLSFAPVLSPGARAADGATKPTAADAPAPGRGQGRRGGAGFLERYHALVNQLSLTDDQKPNIDAAFAEAKTAVQDVTKDAAGDPAAARDKMKPIREALTAKVVAVLTDDQKAKLKELQAAERPAGGRRGQATKPAN